MKYLLYLLPLLFLACDTDTADSETADAASYDEEKVENMVEEELAPANMAPEFVEVLNAHGGLENWNDMEGYSFLLRDFPTGEGERTVTDFHRINLGDRSHHVEGDNYTIVSRNDSTYSTDMEITGFPPQMYQSASFYLAAMPFVFADNGLTITEAGMAEFGDEEVQEFRVAIPSNMGTGGNDFQLFVDPETKQLRYATWMLQYPSMADMNMRQMAEFEEWQTVDGLIVPRVLTLYTAEGEITDETPGATISFERTAFNENPFDTRLFERPEGAEMDDSAM